MTNSVKTPTFLICIRNTGYTASLDLLKLYAVLPDPAAAKQGLVRIVDESHEDYLYPAAFFLPAKFGAAKRRMLAKVAKRRAA
jgi:hypothetical protein